MSFSLRRRLNWIVLGLILVSWVTSAVLTAAYARRVVNEQIDRQLVQYADLVDYVTHIFAHQMGDDVDEMLPWLGKELDSGRLVPLIIQDRLARDDWVDPALNIWMGDELIATLENSPQFPRPTTEGFSYPLAPDGSGRHWRLLSRFNETTQLWQVVGFEMGQAQWALLRIGARILVPLLVILPLSLVLMYFGVSRALGPVNRLVNQIRQRNPRALDPLEVESVPREIEPLVVSLNSLLQRLSYALESEQRFTANAAHELMTPLTAIKTEVQLCQRRMPDQASRELLDRVVARVDRASHTVEQLLTLARIDPDAPLQEQEVVLSMLLTEVLVDTAHLASNAQLAPVISVPESVTLTGNGEALAILLRNLLVNAFRYATPGTEVSISLVQTTDRLELSICNECAPLSAGEFRRITDRFYRVPGSVGLGAGLGLSIVSRIAQQHGARFTATPFKDGQGFCARVSFSPSLSRELHPAGQVHSS